MLTHQERKHSRERAEDRAFANLGIVVGVEVMESGIENPQGTVPTYREDGGTN